MKKIDIIHYHLKPGGVTKIIQSQIESLNRKGGVEIRLLCGECRDPETYTKMGVDLVCDEVFAYADFNEKNEDVIKENIKKAKEASQKYFEKDRIIHFHNLNLGKNPYWMLAINELVSEGYSVVNHSHDFSEDRTENQNFINRIVQKHAGLNAKHVMYPNAENYQVATLTK
ncbi:MAG TPA: hypothetical protein VJ946_05865, partial [Bacteroidales bacterium]|nr:hypothetical protein [Bacteroidales bacterium]